MSLQHCVDQHRKHRDSPVMSTVPVIQHGQQSTGYRQVSQRAGPETECNQPLCRPWSAIRCNAIPHTQCVPSWRSMQARRVGTYTCAEFPFASEVKKCANPLTLMTTGGLLVSTFDMQNRLVTHTDPQSFIRMHISGCY